jgi:hypothetical protein
MLGKSDYFILPKKLYLFIIGTYQDWPFVYIKCPAIVEYQNTDYIIKRNACVVMKIIVPLRHKIRKVDCFRQVVGIKSFRISFW